jgi:serine/threonine-protein kinase RsbT
LKYAGSGEIALRPTNTSSRRGLLVVARDEGPGIPDVALALQDGYSTSNGLGLGLPGTRRLMDEFAIESVVGRGTTVTAQKWV